MSERIVKHLPVRRVSPKGEHCFFGYFDKYPWSVDQRYLLAHKTASLFGNQTSYHSAVYDNSFLQFDFVFCNTIAHFLSKCL